MNRRVELAEFQKAAVDRACKALLDPGGSRRFLVADEVGLGKTMVAQGVVARFAARRKEGLVVVYLCSNQQIAHQNSGKLKPDGLQEIEDLPERLTLVPSAAGTIEAARRDGLLSILRFTPETSLKIERTGSKGERLVLLSCLWSAFENQIRGDRLAWAAFFKCGAGDGWWEDCAPKELARRSTDLQDAGLLDKVIDEWRKASSGVSNLLSVLPSAVREFARTHPHIRPGPRGKPLPVPGAHGAATERARVIGALRMGAARASLRFLRPDLLILDEVQRFKDVLDLAGGKTSDGAQESPGLTALKRGLFQGFGRRRPAVMILSATPYNWLTLESDPEDHYSDFRQTLCFLKGDLAEDDEWIVGLDRDLKTFGKALMGDAPLPPEALRDLQRSIQERLRTVMCRTERNRYIPEDHKGVDEQLGSPDGKHCVPSAEELREFLALSDFRRRLKDRERDQCPVPAVLDYWKSAPASLAFLDKDYALVNRLPAGGLHADPLLVPTRAGMAAAARRNLKVHTLIARLRESAGTVDGGRWKFLWAKPAYPYYADSFFGKDVDPRKVLVFSRWRFVPRAVSHLVSLDIEPHRKSDDGFRFDLNSEGARVCLPLLSLAQLTDPFQSAAGRPLRTLKQVRADVRHDLEVAFLDAGIRIAGPRSAKFSAARFWAALLRLEVRALSEATKDWPTERRRKSGVVDLIAEALRVKGSEDEEGALFLQRLRSWAEAAKDSRSLPPAALEAAVDLALGSPAVCILRTMLGVFPEPEGYTAIELLQSVLPVALMPLRSWLNRPPVRDIFAGHSKARRQADRVLAYCQDAHLQAVLDEYGFLLRDVERRGTPAKWCQHLGRVLDLAPAAFRIWPAGKNVGRASPRPVEGQKRSYSTVLVRPQPYFAIPFGEGSDTASGGGALRKQAVREAFCSPFWPFVLATTSVGQEGLDFHPFCRDVFHWNLPSNPVDLEQREGRINRRDGVFIRRQIASDYPIQTLSRPETRVNPWDAIFRYVQDHPLRNQEEMHGLWPHWVCRGAEGGTTLIRRHVPWFAGDGKHPLSRDERHYRRLVDYLILYRLAFGQPRQQDLIERIRARLSSEATDASREEVRDRLLSFMVNLSPIHEDHAWIAARAGAARLAESPERTQELLDAVRHLAKSRAREFKAAEAALQNLFEVVERGRPADAAGRERHLRALQALVYLRNPFDEVFDDLQGVGLEDDVRHLLATSREVGPVGPE